MQNFLYRAARLDDVPQLVNLRFLMISETSSADSHLRTPEFEQSIAEYFRDSLTNETYFGAVAELNGELVSTNGVVFYRKPPSFRGTTGIVGYLTNVYTVPEFRRQGIASELMKLLVAEGKRVGAGKIHLGTTDEGRGLYEKFGFKDVAFPVLELRF